MSSPQRRWPAWFWLLSFDVLLLGALTLFLLLARMFHKLPTAAAERAPWRDLLPPIDLTDSQYAYADFQSADRTTTRLRRPRYESL